MLLRALCSNKRASLSLDMRREARLERPSCHISIPSYSKLNCCRCWARRHDYLPCCNSQDYTTHPREKIRSGVLPILRGEDSLRAWRLGEELIQILPMDVSLGVKKQTLRVVAEKQLQNYFEVCVSCMLLFLPLLFLFSYDIYSHSQVRGHRAWIQSLWSGSILKRTVRLYY